MSCALPVVSLVADLNLFSRSHLCVFALPVISCVAVLKWFHLSCLVFVQYTIEGNLTYHVRLDSVATARSNSDFLRQQNNNVHALLLATCYYRG